ncbi:hypothetical protein L593_08935 [Salinarchaeum sp. Harcht-Bsk1]|uniref:hypothetical protein n=1 Tax=Salinarchaeum sp. Harcht-Bsk1 TaxID=1333523 RepID=UPI0003423816|nr:hypothetical protein [Salinarchaeum sp. Harcht-Bsk1]AGN01732.1 hypothetical protein L593_08935 [Salinarchaeum sp. Harcht-Bsk1]
MDDQAIKNEIVYAMVRKRITGGNKKQVTTIVGMPLPSHLEGRGKALIDDLVQDGVVERYGGGHRANVRLSSLDAGVAYLRANDGEVPFGFE